MKRNHLNKGTTMDKNREATMKRILENRPLLMRLREEDREALIQLYTKNLNKWEKSNG